MTFKNYLNETNDIVNEPKRQTYQYFLKQGIRKLNGVRDSNFTQEKNNFYWNIEVKIRYPDISIDNELDKIYFEALDLLKAQKQIIKKDSYEHTIGKNKNHIITIKFMENI